MIPHPEKMDRGRFLFEKYSQAVTNLCTSRVNQYHQSKVYAGLKNRCKLNDDMIDNVFRNTQSFISDISPPIIRKAYREFKAIFSKFFEQDPLFVARATNEVSEDAALEIQRHISDNLEKTYFRENALYWLIDEGIRYGTCVAYTFATDEYNAGSLLTIRDEEGFGDFKQVYGAGEKVTITTAIHPLNAIVDPRTNYMVSSDFIGFIGDITIANLSRLIDNPNYIPKNLKDVISTAKSGLPDEFWYGGPQSGEVRDYSKGHANITYLWTRLPIENNEDDPLWYAVEIIGGKIIRINENKLDYNTIPIALGTVIPRPYVWNGNSPLEDKVAVQNMMNWLINTEVESTMRLMDRWILYRQGTLDITDINLRHRTGGVIPYRGQEDLKNLVFTPQWNDPAFRNMDWLVREMRQEDQETSPIANLQNRYNQGGLNNQTLGGAQMIANIGEMLTVDMINNFATGLKQIANHHLVLSRAINPENKALTQSVKFVVKPGNIYNYARQATDAKNALTDLINYRATQIPEFTAVNIDRFMENWIRGITRRESIDDYIDRNRLAQIKQAAANPQPQKPQPKPPATSLTFKDLPPDGQVQLAAQAGINLNPQLLMAKEKMENAPKPQPGAPQNVPAQ